MSKEPASASRAVSVSRVPRLRSAVTNGKRLHVVPPGDTRWARRFRDILAEIVADLGGPCELSEAQRQLARRAATIAIACEQLEAKAVAGKDIDLDCYGTLTDRLGRAFGRLGLKRVARDATPTLEAYLSATYGNRAEETSHGETASESPEADSASSLALDRETALPELPTAAESPSSAEAPS